jgi:hypothetical protein
MNIQINMNQKKKTTIAHSTLPKVHSYASIEPLPYEARLVGRGRSLPEVAQGCMSVNRLRDKV